MQKYRKTELERGIALIRGVNSVLDETILGEESLYSCNSSSLEWQSGTIQGLNVAWLSIFSLFIRHEWGRMSPLIAEHLIKYEEITYQLYVGTASPWLSKWSDYLGPDNVHNN